jgi:hypothetical protein
MGTNQNLLYYPEAPFNSNFLSADESKNFLSFKFYDFPTNYDFIVLWIVIS